MLPTARPVRIKGGLQYRGEKTPREGCGKSTCGHVLYQRGGFPGSRGSSWKDGSFLQPVGGRCRSHAAPPNADIVAGGDAKEPYAAVTRAGSCPGGNTDMQNTEVNTPLP